MALFAEIITRGNQAILAQIRVENKIHHARIRANIRTDIDDLRGKATRNHNLVLGHLNLTLTATDHHEEELEQVNTQLDNLATNTATTITTAVTTDLNKLEKRVGGMGTLMGHYRTKTKNLTQQLLYLQRGFDARLSKLAVSIVETVHTSHSGTPKADNTTQPTLDPAPANPETPHTMAISDDHSAAQITHDPPHNLALMARLLPNCHTAPPVIKVINDTRDF